MQDWPMYLGMSTSRHSPARLCEVPTGRMQATAPVRQRSDVSLLLNAPPISMRSDGMPSSPSPHRTSITLLDAVRSEPVLLLMPFLPNMLAVARHAAGGPNRP
jgi:hypothetical protein